MKKTLFLSLFIMIFLSACGQSGRKRKPSTPPATSAATSVATPPATSATTTVPPAVPPPVPVSKPVVNVYIENSGSMYGYVKGVTEFEQSVYNYLSDIKISKMAKTLNLFYINSKIIPQGSDIADFIEKLEPGTFKAKGGDGTTSDFSNIVKTILSKTDDATISILVSDCIFSPGKGKNAGEYLVNQQIGIKVGVANYLDAHPNSAILIYQLSSQFDGVYYNREDSPAKIKAQRPFYIWLIGDAAHLAQLRQAVPEKTFHGSGVQNIFSISSGNKTVNYAVHKGSGNFSLDKKDSKKHIIGAKKNSKGKKEGLFTFSVDVDFSSFLLNDDYLKESANYQLSGNDYQLNVSHSPSNPHGYTHSLNLSSSFVHSGAFSIQLLAQIPSWVEAMNDDVGLDIHAPGAMQKTYGIKYIMNGIYEAFTKDHPYYTNITVNIN
jgi:hypothetical protein